MKDTMRVDSYESSVANVDTSVQGFIDDFWTSVDNTHTPASIELIAALEITVRNGSNVDKKFPFTFRWFEDAATQNTRMKNIFAAITAGITAAEAASSYTTVLVVEGTVTLNIIYS